MSRKRIRVWVVTVLGMIWACYSGLPAAQAHAIILESAPRREESVAAPKTLVLRFNSRLERPLCSGAYHVRWKVMAADGHVTEGTVLFTVVESQPGRGR